MCLYLSIFYEGFLEKILQNLDIQKVNIQFKIPVFLLLCDLVAGATGEGLVMTLEERKELASEWVRVAKET